MPGSGSVPGGRGRGGSVPGGRGRGRGGRGGHVAKHKSPKDVDCRNGVDCDRRDCHFKHPKGRSLMAPGLSSLENALKSCSLNSSVSSSDKDLKDFLPLLKICLDRKDLSGVDPSAIESAIGKKYYNVFLYFITSWLLGGKHQSSVGLKKPGDLGSAYLAKPFVTTPKPFATWSLKQTVGTLFDRANLSEGLKSQIKGILHKGATSSDGWTASFTHSSFMKLQESFMNMESEKKWTDFCGSLPGEQ